MKGGLIRTTKLGEIPQDFRRVHVLRIEHPPISVRASAKKRLRFLNQLIEQYYLPFDAATPALTIAAAAGAA